MNNVKIAIIGAGAIVEQVHLKHLIDRDDVSVEAIVDIDQKRCRQLCETYSIPHYFQSVDEMVSQINVDGVLICTPNTTHIPIAIQCAKAGIHIFIEKPIGVTLDEVDEYINVANSNQVLTMVGMTHRFRNDVNILKNYIDNGELGEIHYVKAKIFRRRGTPLGWFTNQSLAGGGALFDIGVHMLDLAWYLMGEPKVQSITGQALKSIGAYKTNNPVGWQSTNTSLNQKQVFDVDDFATAWMRFDNGTVLSLEVAWASNGEEDQQLNIELYGNKGGAKLSPLTLYKEEYETFVETKPSSHAEDPFKYELNHFITSVKTGQKPDVNEEKGYEVLKMLIGIYESSKQEKEIYFNKERI